MTGAASPAPPRPAFRAAVNDIGIMIYGSGDFVGYSWEIVAKTFREHIGNTVFSNISECGDKFIEYLASDIFKNDPKENFNALTLFDDAVEDVKEEIGKQPSKAVYKRRLIEIVTERIELVKDNVEKSDVKIEKKEFMADYLDLIKDIAKDTFECAITRRIQYLIADFLFLVFRSKIESPLSTGVVLAGYGSEQYYPELIDYKVDGRHGNSVRQWVHNKVDLNEKDASTATVVPFAQSDMFQLFMEGITNDHLTFIRNTLIRVLNHKSAQLVDKYVAEAGKRRTEKESQRKDNTAIMRNFFVEFSKYVQQEMIQPVVTVISTLPKEEMAAMAEALVEITTLKRKVDSSIESVGGPTDVAIISKGDGLVWIKRKHYFELELNRDFLRRKDLRIGDGDAAQNEG